MGCMEEYGTEFDMCPFCGYVEGTPVEEQIHMEPGTVLHDRYIIGRVLGFGGFGVTYIGWDSKLEMKVAVKEYLPSEFSTRMPGQTLVTVFRGEKQEQFREGLDKFVDEAKKLANFKNEDGIVRVYDSFRENDTAYIIMEYLDGETLTELLDREGTISEDKAVEMMMPIMKSLEVVHKAGILHRDIAPDNIFITKEGNTKLIDFGASRYATTSHSRSLTVIIKPGYSPEEQYRSTGDQGSHTDVYALGATLYKMLTGKTPPDAMERRARFEGQNKDILIEPRKINKEISQVREVAILNAMNVRVQDRTPDVQTFVDELESVYPAKRRYGRIKKIDVLSWPLWIKIAIPAVMSLILVFGILLVTGVVSFSSLFSGDVSVPEGYVATPNVEGLSLDEAYNKLNESQLQPKLEDSVISDYVEANIIITQTPAGGQYSKIDSEVSLIVSKGTGEVIEPINGMSVVPFLVGSKESVALADCKTAGLKPKTSYEYSDYVAEGLVVSQDLAFHSKVKEGSEINLVISKGRNQQQNTVALTTKAIQMSGTPLLQSSVDDNLFQNENSGKESDPKSGKESYKESETESFLEPVTTTLPKKVGLFDKDDMIFRYNGQTITPFENIDKVISKIGQPKSKDDELDLRLEYDTTWLFFNDKKQLRQIDTRLETNKGINGLWRDSIDDVIAAYGEYDYQKWFGGTSYAVVYSIDNYQLGFVIDIDENDNHLVEMIKYSYDNYIAW